MKPLFVFDGESPEFKRKERERRKELKMQAMKEYEMAEQEQDIERMKKYAARTSLLTKEMVDDAKRLLDAMGIPFIQAKSEGEAEAARLVSAGKAYASASEDYDSLLFGSPRLIRQLSVTGKRRISKKLGTYTVQPQMITLERVLNEAGLDRKQLIALGILVGTDFNIGGVKGIGPKKGLKMVKEYEGDFEKMFKEAEYEKYCETPWDEIMEFFLNPPDSGVESFEFKSIDEEKLKKMLVEEYEFSEERVNKFLDRMSAGKEKGQVGLNKFFG
jgi:flap endonuclease-1